MIIYPFASPIILNNSIFSEYGGHTGTFTNAQLQSSYLLAEQQVSNYIGTLLLPTIVTGTYGYESRNRLITDYGYVSRLLVVNVLSRQNCTTCSLQENDGCGYIWDDTYGYVDFHQVASVCACCGGWGFRPYQIQLVYEAGLPTGTANMPGILEALTIIAQIDLNEKVPGLVGVNEGSGNVGIEKFTSMDYSETRRSSSLKRTGLGDSPKSNYAARLIDASIRKARRVLRM